MGKQGSEGKKPGGMLAWIWGIDSGILTSVGWNAG
jgi:hypothetical protein